MVLGQMGTGGVQTDTLSWVHQGKEVGGVDADITAQELMEITTTVVLWDPHLVQVDPVQPFGCVTQV